MSLSVDDVSFALNKREYFRDQCPCLVPQHLTRLVAVSLSSSSQSLARPYCPRVCLFYGPQSNGVWWLGNEKIMPQVISIQWVLTRLIRSEGRNQDVEWKRGCIKWSIGRGEPVVSACGAGWIWWCGCRQAHCVHWSSQQVIRTLSLLLASSSLPCVSSRKDSHWNKNPIFVPKYLWRATTKAVWYYAQDSLRHFHVGSPNQITGRVLFPPRGGFTLVRALSLSPSPPLSLPTSTSAPSHTFNTSSLKCVCVSTHARMQSPYYPHSLAAQSALTMQPALVDCSLHTYT